MRCTNNFWKKACMVCLSLVVMTGMVAFGKDEGAPEYGALYESESYQQEVYRGDLFATDLCVAAENISQIDYEENYPMHAAGLFDLKNHQVLFGDRIHERIYPASTTKILTAYVALKYGNPEDLVTVSETATVFEPEASLCGLQVGDQLTLHDLLCGLTLASGNDAGVAIAEHISGSVEEFAKLMNQEALKLGASNTNFVNPHGLHDDNHYTTAYDLYLFFNAAVQDPRYVDIISMKSYMATITGADGSVRNPQWDVTNYYSADIVGMPEGVRVIGGKTGTTDQAGNCVVLYDEDLQGNPYISIIMGAEDKTKLYEDMSQLMSAGISNGSVSQ